jgi:hypothetical protein
MDSKNLKKLQDDKGYIDITELVKKSSKKHYSATNNTFFKTDDGVNIFWKPGEPRSLTHFGEVLASHLARQFGLRSTKYFFAKCDNVKGVISKDYKKENQEEIIPRDFLINYYKHNDNKGYITQHDSLNNIEFITKALKHGVEIGEIKKRHAQSITKKLLKTAMFDIAIQNPDRHFLNWGLLKSDKQYKYIPIFDSERCFNLFLGVKTIQNWFKDYEINPTQKNLQKAKNRIKEINDICNPCLSILPEEDKHFEDGKHYLESLKEYKQAFPNYFNKQLNNLFKLDLEKAFNSVEYETGVKLPGLVKTVAKLTFDIRKQKIKKHFKLENTNEIKKDDSLTF